MESCSLYKNKLIIRFFFWFLYFPDELNYLFLCCSLLPSFSQWFFRKASSSYVYLSTIDIFLLCCLDFSSFWQMSFLEQELKEVEVPILLVGWSASPWEPTSILCQLSCAVTLMICSTRNSFRCDIILDIDQMVG